MIALVAVLVVLATGAVVVVAARANQRAATERLERARIRREVSRAERRLHQAASQAFASMLDAARRGGAYRCDGHR